MEKLKTYVAFIIDESSSMNRIKQDTIDAFNSQLKTLKEESSSPEAMAIRLLISGKQYEGSETFVSIVKFSDTVGSISELTSVDSIESITDKTYSPYGNTALYDAIGKTIEEYKKIPEMKEEGSSALFIILTDGEENCSKEFSHKKLKSMIDELTETKKWTFTFVGAENALEQAVEIGISAANSRSFTATASGVMNLSADMSKGLRSYYGSRNAGLTSVDSFYGSTEQYEVWTN